LKELNFSVHGPIPAEVPLGIDFSAAQQLSEDGTILEFTLKTDLFGKIREGDAKPPITFNFTILGQFLKLSDDGMDLENFAKYHAPAHLFPFVRETIANITARSQLPVLTLGPINVIALLDNQDTSFDVHVSDHP